MKPAADAFCSGLIASLRGRRITRDVPTAVGAMSNDTTHMVRLALGWVLCRRCATNSVGIYSSELQQMYKEYLAEKRAAETEDERDESETRNLVYPADSERAEEPRPDLEPPTAEPPAVAPRGSCNSARANPAEGFATVKIKREYIEVSDSD